MGDWAPHLQEVRVDGTYEGTIILKEPFSPLLTTTLPVPSGWIVSKKAVEERGEEFATSPIGTGPYEFVEWNPKQDVRLQRFADYGGASADTLGTIWDELVLIPIEEDEAGRDRDRDRRARLRRAGAHRHRPLLGERRLHRRGAHDAGLLLDRDEHPQPEAGGHQRPPGDPLRDRRSQHHRRRLRGTLGAGDRDPAARHADRLLGRRSRVRARPRPGEAVPLAGEQSPHGAGLSSSPRTQGRRRPRRSCRRTSPRSAST